MKAEMGKFYGMLHDLSFQNYLIYMAEYLLKEHIPGKEIPPPDSKLSNSYFTNCCGKLLGTIYWNANFHTITFWEEKKKTWATYEM